MSRRTYSGANRLPPLWVWAVVVCLLLLTFVVYRFFFEEPVQRMIDHAFITVNTERLQKFAGNGGGDTGFRVVSLGTSLTRAATYVEGSGQYSGVGSSDDVNLLNISRAGRRLYNFEPLLPQILATHPDVLLVHADLLRVVNYKRRLYLAGRNCRILIRRWLNHVAGLDSVTEDDRVDAVWRMQYSRACGEIHSEDVDAEKIARKIVHYSRKMVLPPSFIELAALARGLGIRIVVLHVSRQEALRQHYSGLLNDWLAGLQTELLPFGDIPIWISPANFEREDYCDSAHMNENGREKFTAWIVPQLTALKSEIQP